MVIGSLVGMGMGMWISIGSFSIKKHLEVLPTPDYNCTFNDINSNVTWMPSLGIATYTYPSPKHTQPDEISESRFV